MTEHVVMYSGGIGSWAAAKRVAAEHGTDNLTLLFTDTLIEDADTYRFLIESAANVLGVSLTDNGVRNALAVVRNDLIREKAASRKGVLRWLREEVPRVVPGLVWIADGRNPWEVFSDTKSFPRFMVDPCSRVLKRELADTWLEANHTVANTTVYVGIDWSEVHRFERLKGFKYPWVYEAPLCDRPYIDKHQMHEWAGREGLEKQRLYKSGAPHANCGGGCVKMGQGGFARLYYADPCTFAEWEENEETLRQELGVDLALVRDATGGTVKPLTLRALRERIEGGGKIDMFDIGGCGCMVDDDETLGAA